MASPTADDDPSVPRRDTFFNVSATGLYALSLGAITVVFPLYALQSGHDAAAVSAAIAASAITQILARTSMGALMRRVPDKHLIAASAVILTLSSGMLLLSSALWVLVASQLIQGVSRALFWTANQTHAVRAHDSAVRGMALNNLWNGAGGLAGPLLCGFILTVAPIEAAIAMCTATAALVLVPSLLLVRFRPFQRLPQEEGMRPRPMWTRGELVPASLMSAVAGVWRGLLNSLVPVVLVQAGHHDSTVSLLMATASASVLLASPLARLVQERGLGFVVLVSFGPIAVGLTLVGLFPQATLLVAAALFLSGLGGGMAQTLGPATAAVVVHREERGQAIATIGTFRAVALFVTPLAAAGLVLFLPATTGLVAITLAASAPAAAFGPLWRRR